MEKYETIPVYSQKRMMNDIEKFEQDLEKGNLKTMTEDVFWMRVKQECGGEQTI